MGQVGIPHLADYPEPSRVPRQQLDVLCGRVIKSVLDGSQVKGAGLVTEVVHASIESFVASRGDLHKAVGQVASMIYRLGAREAHRQPDCTRLEESFQTAHVAVQRGLSQVTCGLITNDSLVQLRQDLVVYLGQLRIVACTGFHRTAQIINMTQDERLAALHAIAFNGATAQDVDQLTASAGYDPTQRYVSVIAVHATLPDAIRNHPHTLVDDTSTQALIPENWNLDTVAKTLLAQVVLGPPSTLPMAHEGVALARNAATLLREGTVVDGRIIVPSTDLLGELLVRGNRLLTELLVEKHLSELEELPAVRRLDLAEILLLSLERGVPLNRVARELGLAGQTAHNRMKALRVLFGDKIDDADQRLEMIVALRSSLERWRKS